MQNLKVSPVFPVVKEVEDDEEEGEEEAGSEEN